MNTESAHEVTRPVHHPAGHDSALRAALEDLRASRWLSMRTLLATTGDNWPLRTFRTQVLATSAARSDVLRHWALEEPGSVDLAVMQARVAVERALLAHRARLREAGILEQQARAACAHAAEAAPADPVPWVCLLALAPLDIHQRMTEHQGSAPDLLLPEGPWELLRQAQHRDQGSREAHHRMLRWWLARSALGPATDYVRWATRHAPPGSPLVLLPLYVQVEKYRRGPVDALVRRQWTREPMVSDTDRALTSWFRGTPTEPRSVLDLSHLAHALWAGRRMADAAQVFQALGPFAAQLPWAHVADAPEQATELMLWARMQAYVAPPAPSVADP